MSKAPLTVGQVSALARPKHTPSLRCTHLLRHLADHAQLVLQHEEKPLEIWNQYVESLTSIPYSVSEADEYIDLLTNANAPGGDAPPKMHFALFTCAMYAIQAMKADGIGERNAAWDLAFDASQWEGLLSGVLHGDMLTLTDDVQQIDDALAATLERARKFNEARRPILGKTEYYLEVMKQIPEGKGRYRATASKIFLDAPPQDDKASPFYWKGRDVLMDRGAQEAITEEQMIWQIQKAKQRHAKSKKT